MSPLRLKHMYSVLSSCIWRPMPAAARSSLCCRNTINRWTKGCFLPFSKKGDLEIAKNIQGINLISIAAKIYIALLPNRIEHKIDKILWKNLEATILFVDFSKAFDSIHRGKMEQILIAYGLPIETIAAIMMLYKNTKVKVHSSDGDWDYFDIVAGVSQGDTLPPYLFIICLDFVLWTSIDKMKDNGFKLSKERSRRYHA